MAIIDNEFVQGEPRKARLDTHLTQTIEQLEGAEETLQTYQETARSPLITQSLQDTHRALISTLRLALPQVRFTPDESDLLQRTTWDARDIKPLRQQFPHAEPSFLADAYRKYFTALMQYIVIHEHANEWTGNIRPVLDAGFVPELETLAETCGASYVELAETLEEQAAHSLAELQRLYFVNGDTTLFPELDEYSPDAYNPNPIEAARLERTVWPETHYGKDALIETWTRLSDADKETVAHDKNGYQTAQVLSWTMHEPLDATIEADAKAFVDTIRRANFLRYH